jgi:hypothetical protein
MTDDGAEMQVWAGELVSHLGLDRFERFTVGGAMTYRWVLYGKAADFDYSIRSSGLVHADVCDAVETNLRVGVTTHRGDR